MFEARESGSQTDGREGGEHHERLLSCVKVHFGVPCDAPHDAPHQRRDRDDGAAGSPIIEIAPKLAASSQLDGSLMLFQLSALLPVLRGLASPCNYVVQREPHFEHIAGCRWRRRSSIARLDLR